MNPTPLEDLNGVLAIVLDGLKDALGDNFVGMYLQGSFAVGDFDEHSDVDYIVATQQHPSDAQVAAIQAVHERVYALSCPWAQHLEGSFVPVDILRSCDRRGETVWYVDHGHTVPKRSDHCNTAIVRQVLRQHGITLEGPVPSTLIDPISVETLRREMVDIMASWGREVLASPDRWSNRFYQGFFVLSYCRVWRDLVTGTVGSKRQGAEWARSRLEPVWADLIDRAWDTRIDPATTVRQPADPEDYAHTLELVERVVTELEAFRPAAR